MISPPHKLDVLKNKKASKRGLIMGGGAVKNDFQAP